MAENDAAADKAPRSNGPRSSVSPGALLRDATIAVGGAALIGVAVTIQRASAGNMARQVSRYQAKPPHRSVGAAARSDV